MITTVFEHGPLCPRNRPTQTRKVAGAVLRWCPACDRQGVAIAAPKRVPAVEAPQTQYRCRTHGKTVNANGTGCSGCAADLNAAKNRKAERRAKARARNTK